MSGRLADELFRRDVRPGVRRDVLNVYCLHAKDDGTGSRPSQATVAAKVGCSEATVKRAVRFWREAEVLIPTDKPRRHGERGRLPVVYRVDLSPIPWKDTINGSSKSDQLNDQQVNDQRVKSTRSTGQIDTFNGSPMDDRGTSFRTSFRTEDLKSFVRFANDAIDQLLVDDEPDEDDEDGPLFATVTLGDALDAAIDVLADVDDPATLGGIAVVGLAAGIYDGDVIGKLDKVSRDETYSEFPAPTDEGVSTAVDSMADQEEPDRVRP